MKTVNIDLFASEIKELLSYHVEQAEYHEAVVYTQLEIANTEPLYTTPTLRTKEDWERLAEHNGDIAQNHRDRVDFIKGLIK